MNQIKAIGFDLFNTLITAEPHAVDEALRRLIHSLVESGIAIESDAFSKAHMEAALRLLEETKRDGRETHNRFWISAALETQGYDVPPDDPRIAAGVDAYFSIFLERCHLIPGTREVLRRLCESYCLGLLSNFTHAPAAMGIIDQVDIASFFDVILISGAVGYRKPHPFIFRRLVDQMGVKKNEVLYVGDDPEADIAGARRAGIQPVWTTCVQDQNIRAAPSVLSVSSQEVDINVPRFSTWEEFFSLLNDGYHEANVSRIEPLGA
jgi:putative hydrolase of the HAD superfamily